MICVIFLLMATIQVLSAGGVTKLLDAALAVQPAAKAGRGEVLVSRLCWGDSGSAAMAQLGARSLVRAELISVD